MELLSNLSQFVGINEDQAKFLVTQLFAFITAIVFNMTHRAVNFSPNSKHAFLLLFGILLGIWNVGTQILGIFAMTTACYFILRFGPVSWSPIINMIVSLGYLSYIHLIIQFSTDFTKELNVTVHDVMIMIHVQKITSLSFGVRDAQIAKKESKNSQMTKSQETFKVDCPNFLEYNSYLYGFMGIMSGPHIFYCQFKDFINNRSYQDGSIEMSTKKFYIFDPSLKYKIFMYSSHYNGASKICTSLSVWCRLLIFGQLCQPNEIS